MPLSWDGGQVGKQQGLHSQMSVLVLGASSQIGYFYLRRLQLMGRQVLAVSRRPREDSADGLVQWLVADIQQLPAKVGLEAVVSFGPLVGLAAWLARLEVAPASKLVATSSMSVVTKRGSVVAAERDLVGCLAEGEQALREQCQRLGMRCTVLRPTIVYGAGRDRSLTPLARRAMRCRVFALPSGSRWRQPVHADDIALAVERCLQRDLPEDLVLELGGGERISANQMFRRVHDALPARVLLLSVPGAVLRLAASALPAIRGPVSRLSMDLVADNSRLTSLLGFEPRAFDLEPWMLGVGEQWQDRLSAQPLRLAQRSS